MKDGIILIDKEKGLSSQRVDSIIKKKFNTKVGHLGTLDPLAEGLLICLTGRATKTAKYFLESRKRYSFTLCLGMRSPSLDLETEVNEKLDTNFEGKEGIIDLLISEYIGPYYQAVPMYSAIKVNGEKSYKMAVKNIKREDVFKDVFLYDAKRISPIKYIGGASYVDIDVYTSKGFYVRQFAKDLGDALGTPSMTTMIRRTMVDKFRIEDAHKIDDITSLDNFTLNPFDYIDIPSIKVPKVIESIVLSGGKLYETFFSGQELYKVYSKETDELLAIYKKDGNIYRLDYLVKNENN